MSRLYTCDSSWARTPRSSRSFRIRRIPVVQQTAACCGSRPVAKALGEAVGEMYSRGIGFRLSVASSRTIRYITGAWCSPTCWACIARSTSLSL